jgi:glycosyltransferase involved in cell wall biosynthesis
MPSVIGFCRLSISTKIPQYLAAGRPVLCYGPSALASNRYFVDHRAGLVVGEQDPKALAAAATQLAMDRELRRRLGENGRKVAVEHHDARRQRERFREVLLKVAGTKVEWLA